MATTALGFDNFYTSTLSAGITASDTTVYLNALPTATEGYLVIEPDSSTQREIIYYTSKGANFVTLPSAAAGRGVGATTAQSHSSGVTAQMNVVAEHFEALQDGTSIADDAITAPKINFGGSGVGVWWEEIGRTSLSVAADVITVSSIPARKYLKILVRIFATGGTAGGVMTFNTDTGANYSQQGPHNGVNIAVVSQTAINIDNGVAASGSATMSEIEMINTSTQEKIGICNGSTINTAGAGTAPGQLTDAIAWHNTAAQISTITITNNGTGDFAGSSQVIVLGHD